jgi:NAD(P)-dependent dehydrogenase (short-subunit alcohol dehydrogenase family)
MNIEGAVALVTGGAHRLGRAIALALAARGARVLITYRTAHREARSTLSDLQASGARAEAFRLDVANAREVHRVFARIARTVGRLDILVNNAAVFQRTPFARLTERAWDAHLDTNLKGAFLCALSASRLMRRRGAGKIINIADWAGERPYRDYLPYCVSKAGVIALTKSLAKELAPAIQVVAVAPGPILPPPEFTPSQRRRVTQRVPLKRWGSPQDIANAVVFAIEGTDFMTGSTMFVDGGQLIA